MQTVDKTVEVAEQLKKLQELYKCSDAMLQKWVVDVKKWAEPKETGKENCPHGWLTLSTFSEL